MPARLPMKFLRADPAASSARPGKNLRDHPDVGNVEAVRGGGEKEKRDSEICGYEGANGERNSAERLAETNHGFAHYGGAPAGFNEAVRNVTRGDAGHGHQHIRERSDFPHARKRKLALVNQVVGQPRQQEYKK